MARNHNGQVALYEVLNKERFSAAQKKELSRVGQVKGEKARPITIEPQQPKNAEAKRTVWVKKPALMGLNSGRIEAYIPYPIAVTAVMGLVLLLIIFFHAGQIFGKRAVTAKADKSSEAVLNLAETAKAAKQMAKFAAPVSRRTSPPITPAAATVAESTVSEPPKAVESKSGDCVIVLKELANSRDLEPAKKYFDEHGIPTEVKNYHGSYFLVTQERYDSIARGTAFDAMVKKIKQVGANYKPPEGYNGFAPHMFNDVYGKKM